MSELLYKHNNSDLVQYLSRACNCTDLWVQVGTFWKLVHYDGADVVKQRLLMHSVFHFWNLLQVTQLEALRLEHTSTHKHTHKHKILKWTISVALSCNKLNWRYKYIHLEQTGHSGSHPVNDFYEMVSNHRPFPLFTDIILLQLSRLPSVPLSNNTECFEKQGGSVVCSYACSHECFIGMEITEPQSNVVKYRKWLACTWVSLLVLKTQPK